MNTHDETHAMTGPNHFHQLAGNDDVSYPPEDVVLAHDDDLRGVLGAFGYNTVLYPLDGVEGTIPANEFKGLTLAATRAPAFRNKLWRSDIGVVCGRESGDLCAVEVSSQAALDAFLGQNPLLKNALITKAPRAFYVWCRAESFRPGTTFKFGDLGLIVDGPPIPVVQRQRRDVCSVVKPGTPVPVKLRELAWPPEIERALRSDWVDAHYPFAVPGPRGRLIANPFFWAGYFADATRLSYDPASQRFYSFDREEIVFLFNKFVLARVVDLMRELASLAARNGVQVDTTPGTLRRVLEALKIIAVRALPDQAAGLVKFIETGIEHCPGQSLTSEEIVAAYKEFAGAQGLTAFTDRQVMNQLPELVRDRFGVSKGHCISRGGKQRRGFPGLRLRKEAEV